MCMHMLCIYTGLITNILQPCSTITPVSLWASTVVSFVPGVDFPEDRCINIKYQGLPPLMTSHITVLLDASRRDSQETRQGYSTSKVIICSLSLCCKVRI